MLRPLLDKHTTASISGLATTNTFAYNGLDTRVKMVNSTGTSNYKRMGAGVTDSVVSDGAATYTPGVSERRSGVTTYLHSGLKDADAQSGSSQTVGASRTYDAFGAVVASSGTWKGPFGYAGSFGYQEDADSSYQLLGHRYYDPSTGRFLTRDPVKDGRNWYAYCENGPLTRRDPAGLSFIDAIGDFFEGVWQLPQELIGAIGRIGGEPTRYIEDHEAVVIEGSWLSNLFGFNITLGHYVLTPDGGISDSTLDHELAHRDQSAYTGPLYLVESVAGYAIGAGRSLLYKGNLHYLHDGSPLEMDADARSGRENIFINEFWLDR